MQIDEEALKDMADSDSEEAVKDMADSDSEEAVKDMADSDSEEAVKDMADSDLDRYLSKKGDRFALKDFLAERQQRHNLRKASLMGRLRDRLQKHHSNATGPDHDEQEQESNVKKIQKISANKETYRVHLRSYHFDGQKKSYLYVRKESGGVKRTMMLNKSMNKQCIINECLNFFFYNGKSQHGELKDKTSPTKTLCKVPQQPTKTTYELMEIIEGAKAYVLIRDKSRKNPDLDPADADENLSLPYLLFFPLWEVSLEEVAFEGTETIQTVCTPKEFEIVVHRGQVLRELIAFFKENPEVDFSNDVITATIVLPNGERERAFDGGGVMRDLLTEFWDDFYEQCTTGTNMKIPCLRHDMEAADWKAVGKVIALGWMLQKILPIRLAPNFLRSALHGIGGDRIREEFLQFIPPSESKILSSALENIENVDMDELLEVLSTRECKVKVTKDNLGAVIDQIAHLKMVQEPAFICECLFGVLISYELGIDIENEFQKITPTSQKLIASLQCEESESKSFKYLKKYIREMDSDSRMVRTLLRFLTASDLMLYDAEGEFFKILVQIVDQEGIARRPVAHTCGRILDLPRMYESYSVFKNEMNEVLNSNIWIMDFV